MCQHECECKCVSVNISVIVCHEVPLKDASLGTSSRVTCKALLCFIKHLWGASQSSFMGTSLGILVECFTKLLYRCIVKFL